MTDTHIQLCQSLLACPDCQGAITLSDTTVKCQGCGHTFAVVQGIPLMLPTRLDSATAQTTQAAWDSEWDHAKPVDINAIEQDRPYADALNHIRTHAPAIDWNVFLELGCGDARKSLVLAREKKLTVVGVDASLKACQRAQALFAKAGCQGLFVVGDLRQLPLKSGCIHYIYAGGSMEHFPETELSVQETFRVLRPQGRITSTVPYISIATLTYAQLWGNIPALPVLQPLLEWVHLRLFKARHMKYGYEKSFTLRKWKKYFQTAGFKQVNADQFRTHMDFQFIPWPWLKAVARALVNLQWFWPVIYVDADR